MLTRQLLLFDFIQAFVAKLQIFNRDIISNSYKYFLNTKEFSADLESHEKPNLVKFTQEFAELINSIGDEFSSIFKQFRQFSET